MQLCIFIFTKLISLCKLRSILMNNKQNISFINKSKKEKKMTNITIVQYLKTIFKINSLLFYKAIRQGLASFKNFLIRDKNYLSLASRRVLLSVWDVSIYFIHT